MKEIYSLIVLKAHHKLCLSERKHKKKILGNFIVKMQIEMEHFSKGILSYAFRMKKIEFSYLKQEMSPVI